MINWTLFKPHNLLVIAAISIAAKYAFGRIGSALSTPTKTA